MKNVLQIMKSVDQWHLWRMEDGRKIPYQVNGASRAKSNDPETWASYGEATDALHRLGDGWNLAFTLGERGLFTGIDFDDAFEVRDNQRKPRGWAVEIFNTIKDRCYAEVSPSGNGFKAIIIGQKPDGSRCSTSKGPDKQAIEIYDHNRFWAFTGEEIVNNVDQEGSVYCINEDVVKEAGLMPAPVAETVEIDFNIPSPSLRSSRASRFSQNETAVFRAESYLDKIDLNTGERNNTIFRASGHIRAFDGISDDQAYTLIHRLNNRFAKGPLSEQELSKAFWSSGVNGTARENKGGNREFVAEAQFDSKSLEAMEVLLDADYIEDVSERSEALYRPSDKSEQIPMDLMRDGGFIEEAMNWIMDRQSEGQPEMAFSAALHMASVGMSRKYKDDSAFETTPNLYSLILAETGSGKDLPRKMVNKFLRAVGRDDLEGPTAIDSGAGLAAGLVKKPSMSMLLDECGDLFSNLASDRCPAHFKKVGTVLKSVYTSASETNVQLRALANNDAGQNDPVDFPHLHILATATPRQVLGTISDNQIEDGLMGRFVLFFGDNDPQEKIGSLSEVPEKMIRWFCKTNRCNSGDTLTVDPEISEELNNPELVIVRRSQEAAERLDGHFIQIRRKTREKIKAGTSLPEQSIWSRASEKTAKLALIFAVSRGSNTIELEDANRAIAINNHLTRRVVKVYKNRIKTEYHERRAEVLRTITTKYTSEPQVFRLNSSIDPQMRVKILNDLIQSKEIHEVLIKGKTHYVLGAAPE